MPPTLAKQSESSPDHLPDRLSVELSNIARSAKESGVTFGELINRLQGRAYTLLLVLLPLPFCQPVAIPGFSVPFGVVIALLGLRFALRQKPWLPQRLLVLKIPAKVLPAILSAGAKLLTYLEKLLHPRVAWIFDYRLTQFLVGATIFASALLLLLPLPIPFSNMFPALTVVVLAASFSERDGLMLCVGGGLFLATLAFFGVLFFGGVEVFDWIRNIVQAKFASPPAS
ncbi:MAG: exopolysaccharide biosynthesis protein [Terrimicrobiaceae bacterium]